MYVNVQLAAHSNSLHFSLEILSQSMFSTSRSGLNLYIRDVQLSIQSVVCAATKPANMLRATSASYVHQNTTVDVIKSVMKLSSQEKPHNKS